MMIHNMLRRILRTIIMQKKFISKSMKIEHHELTLYNENPQKTKSLIVRFPGSEGDLIEENIIKNIKSNNNSRIFSLFNSNYVLVYKGSDEKVISVGEEGIGTEEKIPVIKIRDLIKLVAKTKDSGEGDSVISTGRAIGRLDAANEAGFFHSTDSFRLKEIKKKIKDKKSDPTDAKKTDE